MGGVDFDTDKGVKPPNAFAVVEVPDDEVDQKSKNKDGKPTKIDRAKLKVKYKEWFDKRGGKDIDIGTEDAA